jgi:hypothetical protein
MWTYVVMFILVVMVIVFFVLAYNTKNKNQENATMNILYPFSGYLAPPKQYNPNISKTNPGTGKHPQEGLYLVGQVGGEKSNVPQIKCPTGYKINIVGAFVEVTDPYGECSTQPDPTFQLTCGSNKQTGPNCNRDLPCAQGMTCDAGSCVPKSCKVFKDCGSDVSGEIPQCPSGLGNSCSTNHDCNDDSLICGIDGKCITSPGVGTCMACVLENGDPLDKADSIVEGRCSFMPTCTGVSIDGKNKVCNVSKSSYAKDTYKCRPREATAYLAKHCDGKSTCLGTFNDIWEPNNLISQGNPFGPLPCELEADDTYDNSPYLGLPIISGWGGGVPSNSASSVGTPATFNQGYYVHGIYTCVPEDENVSTS